MFRKGAWKVADNGLVGGAVRGSTPRVACRVELASARWNGEELNIRTTNVGANIGTPNNYSVHLETSISEPESNA